MHGICIFWLFILPSDHIYYKHIDMGTPTIHHHEDLLMLNYSTFNNIITISLGHILNILSALFKKYNLVIQVKKKWKLETHVLKWLKDYFKTFLEHFSFILWNALVAKTRRRMHFKRWPSSKYLSSRVTFPRDNMSECLVTLPSFDNVVFTIEN